MSEPVDMSGPEGNLRRVSVGDLRHRLADMLGEDSLIYRRFARALMDNDPAGLDRAMVALRLYPPQIQVAVDDLLIAWLFGGAPPPEDARSTTPAAPSSAG